MEWYINGIIKQQMLSSIPRWLTSVKFKTVSKGLFNYMSKDQNIREGNSKEQVPNNKEEMNENISQEQTVEATEPQIERSEIPLNSGTVNSKPQPETMEIHHPHHITHKKKWNEYLLEFFMLFLAVFLGFIAENQREHFAESSRAKDYAKSFLSDLKADTAELNAAEGSGRFVLLSIDSITSISANIKRDEYVPGSFYYYSRFMSNLWIVTWSGSTIHQLIQSGNLRYFKNKELIDKINSYYSWQNFIASINQTEHETRMQAADLRNKILQSRYYLLFVPLDISVEEQKVTASPQVDSLMKQRFPLQDGALNYLDEYINLINDRKWRSTPILNNEYPQIKNLAIEIIKLLQKEYNLN